MPASSVKGPEGEKAWKRAKEIVRMSYPDAKEDSDKFWALVQTIYKDVCKSDKYNCESLQKNSSSPKMSEVLERLNGY